MSSIISLLPFDLYKLYSIAVEVYYALRAFALAFLALLPDVCYSAPAANGSPQTGYSPGDSLSTRASV